MLATAEDRLKESMNGKENVRKSESEVALKKYCFQDERKKRNIWLTDKRS